MISAIAIVNSGCGGGAGLAGAASQLLQPVTSTLGSILSSGSAASSPSASPSSQGANLQSQQKPNSPLSAGAQLGADLGAQTLQNLPQGPQDVLGTANRLATAPLQLLSSMTTGKDSTN